MSNNWFNFLSDFGASFSDQQEVSFAPSEVAANSTTSNTMLRGELYLTDLSWLGLIEVSGEDKQTFLQGQLTNDINAVSSTLSHMSGLCTPKGRLRALFSIFSHKDPERRENLYLQLPRPLLEDNLKRLKMFVMMSKVELKDVSDELIKIGVYGSRAEKYLKEAGFSIPGETNMVSDNNGITLIRLSGDTPRFECAGSIDRIKSLWTTLFQPQTKLLSTSQWRLLDIQAGTPNVFAQTSETYIPQMLNLQVLNGVNFKKGCYTGQEVVARMQYLGKLKRRMYRVHCDTDQLPLPGSPLYSAASKSAQGAGNVVDAQRSLQGGVDLLAVITTEAVENNDIFLDEAMQLPLMLQELPYSLETQ